MQVNNNGSAITNNLHGMLQAQTQMNDLAKTVADVANSVGDPAMQEVSQDLVDAITQQIPTQIAYEANAQSIKMENAVQDVLLNIKA